jgi:hypothetical protein
MTADGYEHAEAFCLVAYRSDDGTETELIWNSRDGVTPFVISLRSGKQATHVAWETDQCIPDYSPPPGSRVFVDLTPERARQLAEQRVDGFLADPELNARVLAQYGGREAAVHALATEYLSQPGAPDLIEWTG